MIFQISSQNKNKKQLPPQPQATTASNRSRSLCEPFYKFEETGRAVSLSTKERQILPKVEGDKKNFFFFLNQQVPKHLIQFRSCTLLSPVIFHPRHVFMVNRSTDVMVFPFNYRRTSLWRIVELWQR